MLQPCGHNQEAATNDTTLTAAMLDRLLHHAHVASIQGESFRLRDKRRAGMLARNKPIEKEGMQL